MTKRKRVWMGILAMCGMIVIILDGKTALNSVQAGLTLCMYTVIPALFPFFILSRIICNTLLEQPIGVFQHLGKLCKMPAGSETLLVVGLLSGYPVGAQLVAQAYRDGKISKETAKRMMGFCSNAGPAFIFGMLAPLFDSPVIPWILWIIHIAGALFAGHFLPGYAETSCHIQQQKQISLSQILTDSLRSMATVCGWVILFRVIIGFCLRWFFWLFPIELQVVISGILELSNGCVTLQKVSSSGLRFIFASIFLSCGGICVAMQTSSVAQPIGFGFYFPGKVVQALFSFLASYLLQAVLFPKEFTVTIYFPILMALCLAIGFVLYWIRGKKL